MSLYNHSQNIENCNNPEVSVIMSVYNGEKYLGEAIESILTQGYKNFEFIIINDASTDKSPEIVNSYEDSRIKLIHNEKNLGLTASLIKGISLSQGRYIARMDCDDISLPERLKKQIEFMNENPHIGVCGTWTVSEGEEKIVKKYLTNSEAIKCHLFFYNSLCHPSVMINKNLLLQNKLNYNPEYLCSQDYELWIRCARFFSISNIPEILLEHRLHSKQITETRRNLQTNLQHKILLEQVNYILEGSITEEEKNLHLFVLGRETLQLKNRLLDCPGWIKKLILANNKKKFYKEPMFSLTLLIISFLSVMNFIFKRFKRYSKKDETKPQKKKSRKFLRMLYNYYLLLWDKLYGSYI